MPPRFTLIEKYTEKPLSYVEQSIISKDQFALATLVDGVAVSENDRTVAAATLHKIKEKGAWLLDHRPDTKIIFTVVQRGGRVHLREFSRERTVTTAPAQAFESPWTDMVLDFHHAFGSLAEPSVDGATEGDGGESDGRRTFGGFLIELIHRAKLNEWTQPAPTLAQQRKRLIEAAGDFQIATGIGLSDYLLEYSPANRRRAEGCLRDAKNWPSGGRPYCLFFSVADAVDVRSRTFSVCDGRSRIRLLGVLSMIGSKTGKGDFVTLNTFSRSAQLKPGYYGPIHGCALRVAGSECLLPVESNPEAEIFSLLQNYQIGLHRQGITLTIRKPVRSEVIDAVQVRPDFWLEMNQRRAVIEVMGFDDPEYIARKKTMERVIAPHAAWLEVNATFAGDPKLWFAELRRFESVLGTWISKVR